MEKYSIVIPCYKSSHTIENVVLSTAKELENLGKSEYEFVLVNDCSPDNGETTKVLKKLAEEYDYVKVIELAKNCGQHNALLAGLNYVTGDIIVGMDDDGQTHPSQLKTLFSKLEEGHDVVYGYYNEKKHGLVRNLCSKMNSLTMKILVHKPKDLKTSSFWVAKRFVINEVIRYKGSFSHLSGLFIRTTKDIVCVPIKHFEREYGKSGYTFKTLLKLWSSVTCFSIVPIKLASIIGYICSIGGIIGGIIVFIKKLVNPQMAVGWPSVMVAIFIFAGIILMFLGLVGQYIGRLYLGQNNEPQYVIKEKINLD